ncbi:MAG: hypothetical protein RL095_2765 [Verrucomicrobiota bacterium]|jgi:hypothetical protein
MPLVTPSFRQLRPILKVRLTVLLGALLFTQAQALVARETRQELAQSKATAQSLSRAEALEDLVAFAKRLREESSYLELRRAAPLAAIKDLEKRLPETISQADFARELQKILSPMGDCHSSISCAALDDEAGQYLPFRLAIAAGGLVAVTRSNDAFVEPGFPFLVAIDGKPVKTWLDAALKYEPLGSPSQHLYRGSKGIRRLDILRRDLGLAASGKVQLTFADHTGKTRQTALPCRDRSSSMAEIKIGESRKIGTIGYLRLPEMDDALIPEAKRWMTEFRDSSGLIIDVRGNGGGTYGLMHALFGYFRPAEAPPFVCNIAAYRLAPSFSEDHIEYRPTYRRDWKGWTAAEGRVIDASLKTFKPCFKLPAQQFSAWHFMVLKHEGFQFHYDKPVIVLCDQSCISATDGFLAAFAELPKVTLMGRASRGGSGSSRSVDLPSGITCKLSTMASFRPDGKTFEGFGVDVDVALDSPPTDFINGQDSVLEQALRRLATSK